MLKDKIKEILIEDIEGIKNIDDVKYVLKRLVTSIPSNESLAENLVKAIDKGLKITK